MKNKIILGGILLVLLLSVLILIPIFNRPENDKDPMTPKGDLNTKVKYIPLAYQINGSKFGTDDYISTSLYLKASFKDYNVNYDQLSSLQKDASETAFCSIIDALLSGDPNNCIDFSTPNSTSDRDDFDGGVGFVKYILNRMEITSSDTTKFNIIRRYSVGNDYIFACGVDDVSPSDPNINRSHAMTVKLTHGTVDPNDPNDFRWEGEDISSISLVISEYEKARHDTPQAYVEQDTIATTYEKVLFDPSVNNQVSLCFDGTQYDFDVFGDDVDPNATVDPNDTVAYFYQTIYRAARDGDDPNAFGGYMTDCSQSDYLKSMSEYTSEQIEQEIAREVEAGMRVIFILDANPLYIVFFRDNEDNKLFYPSYIIEEQDNLKLVNFNFSGLMNDFFDNDLFRDRVLNDILKE